jgi:Flp pilus assembly protein TadD
MKLVTIRQIALGTVFAASLAGCAGEETESIEATSNRPLLMTTESPSAYDVDTALAKAQSERHSGEFATARRTVARLMVVAPDHPGVLGEYGKILIAEGRNGEALAFLERAVELDPNEWSLHSARGVAYDLMGNHLDAQAAYERALAAKPGEPTVLSNDAMSHMESGDLDTAEELLMEASQTGADPRIKQNLAMIQDIKTKRAPVAPILAMAPGSGQADVALQLTMQNVVDMAPAADPAPEAPVMTTVPESEPQMDATPPLESDQATRGLSIDYDPILADEPALPGTEGPKKTAKALAQTPAKVAIKRPAKTAAKPTKVSSKKPAPHTQPEPNPAKQAALH